MPRGTTFDELITQFREEAGHAVSRRQGQNTLPGIQQMLRRTYRRLHSDFAWPHLRIEREVLLQAGERYYAFPLDLDFERTTRAWVREVGRDIWHRLYYGIDRLQYNTVHSHLGERDGPPTHWQVYENDQLEVWPIPDQNHDIVRFLGYSRPKALVAGNEPVDLDDDLVVLYAVAEQLARQKSADASLKLEQAQQHYMNLRAQTQKDAPWSIAVSHDRGPHFEGIDIRFAERRG